jgi:hypothetical protein
MNNTNFRVQSATASLRRELSEKTEQASRVFRTQEAASSNMKYPEYGMCCIPLIRKSVVGYADGISTMAVRGPNPSPREISNLIVKQTMEEPNIYGLSDYGWVFGQFIDHLLDITPEGDEEANMVTPPDDEYPNLTIPFKRSGPVINSSPREHPNNMSAYIDAANVYGASTTRSYALRALNGSGKLKTSVADNGEIILPKNVDELPNAPSSNPSFFLAGDVRVNENSFLTSVHTLFLREHNRLCDRFSDFGTEEDIYQQSRRYVTGLMQHITFNEFLPTLLGEIPEYTGYNPKINPGIATEFSTALYRLGHTMVSSKLRVDGMEDVDLKDIFFKPSFVQENGVDGMLKGASEKLQQEIDTHIVEDLRSFLFGAPGSTLLDLACLNIQRGRDHGLPGYNDLRAGYGLPSLTIEQLTSDAGLQAKLTSLYSSADNIDPWIGALAEDKLPGKPIGELLYEGLLDQFLRVRDGDRFWFENDPMMENYVTEIKNTKLSDVINRNCSLTVKSDVFRV